MTPRAGIVICLFRNDLRFHDNEVLYWAQRHGSSLVPLYCFDPRHYQGTWHFDFPKTGPFRLKFLLESIRDLRNNLQKVGSNLIIRRGKPEIEVPKLIEILGKDNVKALALQEEVTREELDVEKALESTCGIPLVKFWGSTLYHRKDLPFTVNNVPNVYTEFRKQVEGGCRIRNFITVPHQLHGVPEGLEEGELPTAADLGVQHCVTDERTAFPFSGGETSALERLQHYLWEENHVSTYKETRNGLVGEDYSTKFSPWLALGCLSPRKIYYEIKRYEKERTANQSTYWVIFELIWRDYFKFVALKFGDKLFHLGGLLDKKLEWKQDPVLFKAWKEGRTGVPFVDANMRELMYTGWMSNRGRQNVASFLTKDLKLDWRLGAEWFEYMLIDHDVCSNYGNWLYSAGIGNDPRQDRKFNMVKQGLDYDPEGEFVKLWVPELSGLNTGFLHTPWKLDSRSLDQAGVSLGESYPSPIVMAPEWNRHAPKQNDNRDKRRGAKLQPRGKTRGLDFYFSSAGSSGSSNKR